MFEMMMSSGKLFLAGKLFQDNGHMFRQLSIGVIVGVAVSVGVAQVAPIWAAAVAGGAISGILQPILFKNLKYA
tara:strand:- start:27632 stop:27853 length:222 start_codon:yes stop_codon:yes gene_type:complete